MRALAILFALPLLASIPPSSGAQAGKDDAQKLQGTWEVTELIVGGVKVPAKDIKGTRFVFAGNKLTLEPPGNDAVVTAAIYSFASLARLPIIPDFDPPVDRHSFTFKLDPTQNPTAVDLTALDGQFKDKVSPGIYELKGNTLRWCQSDDEENNVRPKSFVSPAKSRIYVFTFQRVK